MKKLILWMVMLFVLVVGVSAVDYSIKMYNPESIGSFTCAAFSFYNGWHAGQIFQANDSFNVDRFEAYFDKNGAPTGSVTGYLLAVNPATDTPQGAAVLATYTTYTAASIDNNPKLYNFTYVSGEKNITAGHNYTISLSNPADSSPNYYIWCDDSSGTAAGYTSYNTSAAWIGGTSPNYEARDFYYKMYEEIGSVTTAPSFVSPTPTNAAHNDTNVTLNVSCVDGNVYLWFENASTASIPALVNTTSGLWTTNVTDEGTYFYKAACYNSSLSGFSSNTSTYNWTYDISNPELSLNSNNGFTAFNTSTIKIYGTSLIINVTLTDNIDLYAYSINVSRQGDTLYNETNLSLSGTSFILYKNITINWSYGRVNVSIEVADAHTKNAIKDYDVEKSNKKLKFTTEEGNKITIETDDAATTDARKKKDRYTFVFNFTDGLTKDRTMYIKAQDNKVQYRPDSPFKEHFIVWSSKGGNWIDFEPYLANVTMIDDKYWRLEFQNLPPNVEFQSIGGLNRNSFNYSWYQGNYTLYKPDAFKGEATQIVINLTYDYSIINMSAKLWYNESVVTGTTRKVTAGYYSFMTNFTAPDVEKNYNFSYEINVTQYDNSTLLFNITDSQRVRVFGIDNCSDYNFTTLRLIVREENSPTTPLNATIEVDSVFWVSSPLNSFNYSTQFVYNHTYTMCLSSDDFTLYSNFYIKYNSTNTYTHRYYIYNGTFTNTTQNLTIYNWKTDNASDLNLVTRYSEDYTYFPDVVTRLERRYIAEGIWRIVQMDLSDEQGNMHFNIVEDNVDYRLSFYDTENHLLKTTDRYKFTCTSGICSITFLLEPYDATAQTPEYLVDVSFNNLTKIITINYIDTTSLSSTTRIDVTKQTMKSMQTICSNTYASYSGTATCNVTGYSGEVLIQVYSTASPEAARWFEWLKISNPLLSEVIGGALGGGKGAVEGTFIAVGMIFTITAAGLFSPAAAVLFLVLGVILTWWFGLVSVFQITLVTIISIVGIAIIVKVRD